jgi:hypothetical protein
MKSVKIGPIKYKIKKAKELRNEAGMRMDGYISYNDTTISLEKDNHPQVIELTLWHEIVHGMATQSSIELEEREVELLAYSIMSLFHDNDLDKLMRK